MSSQFHPTIPIVLPAANDANATGDKQVIYPGFKCEVVEAFVCWKGNSAHATAAVIAFDKRIKASSDTGRSNNVFVVKKTANTNEQGVHVYKRLSGNNRCELAPGQELVVNVTTAQGEALNFQAGVLVREVPEVPANLLPVGNNGGVKATA